MNNAERYRQLQAEMAELERQMARCNHDWDVKYCPIEEDEVEYEMKMQGVDPYYVANPTGRKITKDRWSRTCRKCGKTEYTTKQGYVTVTEKRSTGPQF